VISDKSQGSVAAHLRCGELFSYHLTMYFSLILLVKSFKIGERLAKLQPKRLIALCAMFALQDEELAR